MKFILILLLSAPCFGGQIRSGGSDAVVIAHLNSVTTGTSARNFSVVSASTITLVSAAAVPGIFASALSYYENSGRYSYVKPISADNITYGNVWVHMWVKSEAVTATYGTVMALKTATTAVDLNVSGYGAGIKKVFTEEYFGGWYESAKVDSPFLDKSWHMLDFTRFGNVYTVYNNGKAFLSATSSKNMASTVITEFIFGHYAITAYPQQSFNGYVDDVALFGRQPTTGELSRLYQDGLGRRGGK